VRLSSANDASQLLRAACLRGANPSKQNFSDVNPDTASAVVYACGPPAMLEAVRTMCAGRGVATQLALESPMACGFGACFGCAVPKPGGGYLRLCVDGPVLRGEDVAEVAHV